MNEYRVQRLKEDLTFAQQRNKRQRQQLANYKKVHEKDLKEIERLNNIINELEEELERESNMKEEDTCLEHNTFIDIKNTLKTVLKRLQELKGSDSNE